MAAIGRKTARRAFMAAVLAMPLWAKSDFADPRATLSYVCVGLASGNASDAMRGFDESLPNYEQLAQYFSALTSSFEIVASVEVTDITDGTDAKLVEANWTLQLTSRQDTGVATTRRKPEKIKFVRKGSDWKIVDVSDLSLFAP
jgi:hypothetical protein